jgi:hypothetical protein
MTGKELHPEFCVLHFLQFRDEMDLAGDFDEAERGIEVIANRVLSQSFDFCVRQSRGAEMGECMLDQGPAETLISVRFSDG